MCHSRYHHRHRHSHRPGGRAPEWGGAPEPREPDSPHLRVSDAERERTVEALRAHAGAGRLEAEELEDRIGKAFAAKTRGELAALVADLPGEGRRTAPEAPRPRGKHHPGAFVPIALLLIAIWAVTGAGYFWPVWPLMWFAFASLGGMWRGGGNTRVIGNSRVIR